MTQDEFIANIQQELSVACALPFTVPVPEIERIIKYSAEWFYKKYEDSVEERYYIIPTTLFQTDQYKRDRTVTMPDCVFSIFQLKKLKEDFARSMSFDGTADFGIERLFLSDSVSLGQGTENLMYYTLNMYWLDVASHIINHTISFNYNRNSNRLFFGGETPNRDCVALCYVKLPIEHLMTDEIFYRYVVAKCKVQLSRILGTFNFNLPGNIQINYDLIRSEGTEEIANIIEEIKSEEGMDFFLTSGGA
tara:strand:- start:10159 stop:10905 length:747 start_codon:yes stop_codon:yes gene_type:complete